MLEEQVILVSDTADATEDVATHEVISVGAKAVNDLVHVSALPRLPSVS
jgi:hypothetical protein